MINENVRVLSDVAALALIAAEGCATTRGGDTCWDDPRRYPGARYAEDQICPSCIARAGLP